MALLKVQIAILLVTCFLLFTTYSKPFTPNECNFRGTCNTAADCKARCEAPEFPPGTIGKCVVNHIGTGHLCCCTVD
ncbi:hypothetical protein Bca4012_021674 [Brassica carinata]